MFSLHIDTAVGWHGEQSLVLHTVLGLRAHGHRAALVAHPDGELLRRLSEGYDLVPLAPRGEVDLSAAWRLSRVLKQLAPDVIHAYDAHAVAMASTALSIADPTPKPPLVTSIRTEAHLSHSSFSRWKYSQIDCFIANSTCVHDRLVADGVPHAKTATVNQGVDVERIVQMEASNVHAALYLPTHSPVIGNVATLAPNRGHHHLIDAAQLVVREVPDARFVIVGDGELREGLEKHVRDTHLERHVFLAGFRADAVELIKAFDVFAMSPIAGGLCTALIESMAASKAAVATSVGAIPEIVVDGDTGFLTPARDHAAMAAKLILLLKDRSLRDTMGAAALARARDRFTVERMVAETSALYDRLTTR
ncbi:MAG: glycosyltransferase [Acidobacteria bacterium]|nr:glycosyltransferase [Acidobacteriota bacterium]